MTHTRSSALLARSPVGRLLRRIRWTTFADVLSARHHSRDFDQLRAESVFQRVRVLAFALAAAAPLWIPVDMVFLASEQFWRFFALRLGFSGGLLVLGLWTWGRYDIRRMRLRLGVLIGVPALFYVGSRVVVGGGLPADGVLMGYTFLPLLMAALLGIFPLTLREGLAYAGVLALAMVGTNLAYGTAFTIPHIRDTWLLILLFVVAFWGQLSQLVMLLRLHREATRDPLTGLVNRRVLVRQLEDEVRGAQARDRPLSVLLFDLDMFKRVNDTHGHLTGDRALEGFAEVLREALPDDALAGRYGGEEFMAILPGWDLDAARERAEAIRRAWGDTSIPAPDGPLRLTVSTGVAGLYPGEEAGDLLGRVDEGLYEAKEAGRNLVVTTG